MKLGPINQPGNITYQFHQEKPSEKPMIQEFSDFNNQIDNTEISINGISYEDLEPFLNRTSILEASTTLGISIEDIHKIIGNRWPLVNNHSKSKPEKDSPQKRKNREDVMNTMIEDVMKTLNHKKKGKPEQLYTIKNKFTQWIPSKVDVGQNTQIVCKQNLNGKNESPGLSQDTPPTKSGTIFPTQNSTNLLINTREIQTDKISIKNLLN